MSSVATRPALHRPVRRSAAVIGTAAILLVVVAIGSLAVGPVLIAPQDVMRILIDASSGVRPSEGIAMRDAVVILDIRLPRTVLTLLVGASLATAGAVLQGVFRNPLADPGLVGVSTGAAFAAVLWIVFGGMTAA